MFELETLFAPKDSLVSKGFDLFNQKVILEAEAKPELYSKIPYEWMDEDIRFRRRKSVLGKKYGLKWLQMSQNQLGHHL